MAGLKRSKKQAKRKSNNKRSKRNIKTINNHSKKNKKAMVGGVLPYSMPFSEFQLKKRINENYTRKNRLKYMRPSKIPTEMLKEQFITKNREDAYKRTKKVRNEMFDKKINRYLPETDELPSYAPEMQPESVESLRYLPFFGPSEEYMVNIPGGTEDIVIGDNEQKINGMLIELQKMFDNEAHIINTAQFNIDNQSRSAIDGFTVLNNKSSNEIYDDVFNLVVNEPLSFIVNYERIIKKNTGESKDFVYVRELYNSEYKTALCNFFAEFYEGDYNVYDKQFELNFTSVTDEDLLYLCISHMCYLARKMVKDKLLALYNTYTSSLEADGLPIMNLDKINLESDYLISYDEILVKHVGHDDVRAQQLADERIAKRTDVTGTLEYYNGDFMINPDKINIHDYTDFEKLKIALSDEIDKGYPSFSINFEEDSIYDEIYDFEHNCNLDVAYNFIKKAYETYLKDRTVDISCNPPENLDLECYNKILINKSNLNCEHAMGIIKMYNDYILRLKQKINSEHKTNKDTVLNWTLQLAMSLANYGNDDYYKNGTFNSDLDYVLNNVINFEEGGGTLLDYLKSNHDGWFDYVKNIVYGQQEQELPQELPQEPLGGGMNAIKKQPLNLRGGDLSADVLNGLVLGHMIYDNSHDFEFLVKRPPNCDKLCSSSLITANVAVKNYEKVDGEIIEGSEDKAKEGMMKIIEKNFPTKVVVKSYDITGDKEKLTKTLKEIQSDIKTKILKIDSDIIDMRSYTDQNKSTYFYYDQGSVFIQIMFQNKLPGLEGEKIKLMDDFQQNTLLKAWDSSTGGTAIGNIYLQNILKKMPASDPAINTKLRNLTIAFNLHSFMSMTEYFKTYVNEIKLTFSNPDLAVVPILQTELIKPGNTTFKHFIQFMQIDHCISIRDEIIILQESKADDTIDNILDTLIVKKYINPISFNMVDTKLIGPKPYEIMAYNTSAKFSAGAIMRSLGLGVLKSRCENTNTQSILNVANLFKHPSFKSLNETKKSAYGFMIKHSGDQCQGYQTQEINRFIYGKIIDSITENVSANTTHVLYTDDILAFCNAVYNGSNVFTLKHAGSNITLIHTTTEFGVTPDLIQRLHTTLSILKEFKDKTLKDELHDKTSYANAYNNELNYFQTLITEVVAGEYNKDELKKDTQKAEKLKESIAKIESYNKYINTMNEFKVIADVKKSYAKAHISGPVAVAGQAPEPVLKTWPIDANVLRDVTLSISPNYILSSTSFNGTDIHKGVLLELFKDVEKISSPSFYATDTMVEINNLSPIYIKLITAFNNTFANLNGKEIKSFVKSIIQNSTNVKRDWFNKLKKYLYNLTSCLEKINRILRFVDNNMRATNLFNNKQRLQNFESINNDLYRVFEIVRNILINPSNVELLEKSMLTVIDAKKTRYDMKIQGPLIYYLIKNIDDKNKPYFNEYKSFVDDINEIEKNISEITTKYTENNDLIKKILTTS